MNWHRVAVALVLSGSTMVWAVPLLADEPAPAAAADSAAPGGSAAPAELSPEELAARKRAFEEAMGFKSGKVSLAGGLAELDVPEGFRYVDKQGADKILQAWGNPPDAETEGMLFTKELGPLDDDSWGVVIRYSSDGHVSDEDAEDTNFDELLEEMRKTSEEENTQRKQAGLETVKILRWAEPPHYDEGAHKLYWAKELEFGGNAEHTLNYSIRVLGREGVLELNAVAGMKQLPMIKQRMGEVLRFSEFTGGNKYGDYKEGKDKLAAYGIGALVAGGVAAKTGMLKGLIALLIASKKFLIAGAVALVAGVKALLGRRNKSDDAPAA